MKHLPKAGDILYVKSTEEPTTVLAVREMNDDDKKRFPAQYEGSGTVIVVRRPRYSEAQGTTYHLFDFLAEELETDLEQSRRKYASLKARQEMVVNDFGVDTPLGAALGAAIKDSEKN